MPRPEKPFFALDELAQRWAMSVRDIGSYAVDGLLTLAIVVVEEVMVIPVKPNCNKQEAHSHTLQGVVPVFGLDVWRAIKEETVTVKRFLDTKLKTPLVIQSEDQYQIVALSDIVVVAGEVRRFETVNKLSPVGSSAVNGGGVNKGGAPSVIAWQGYWVNNCVRVFQDGIPETAAELVREGMEWFAANSDRIPDVRSVERAVKQLMRALQQK